MDRKERRLERFRAGASAMSAEERRAIGAAMDYARRKRNRKLWKLVTDIGAAAGRDVRRRQSNRVTEPRRRRLVGAHMPIGQADRCRACAAMLGISQYRFVAQALERECRMAEAGHNLTWDGEGHRSMQAAR